MNLVGGAAAKAVDSAFGGIAAVIDAAFTSDEEKLEKQVILERLRQEPARMQVLVNMIEAKHRTVFVAGWRPFIGWVCGVALAYHYIAYGFIGWAMALWAPDVQPPPQVGIGDLLVVLGGLLGLGTLRTREKEKGVTQ